MPEHTREIALETSQRAAFALPCAVARGIAYLSDPAVIFGALPSMERVIQRQHGAYRLMLGPIHVLGVSLRPAAEVEFATTDAQIAIRSIAAEPHDLQPGEVAARITGRFVLTPTATGCGVRASLRVAARVPARVLPPLVPRVIAQRTAATVLTRRITQEVRTMTRTLVQGYTMWEGSEFGVRGSE
jgi:uncharacterized protein DUF1997